MKNTLNTVRVGLFFILGMAVIWIVYETLQEGRLLRADGYTIYGQFEDVKMLRSGDDVRVSGVRVGRIVETRLRNGLAEAVMEIEPEVQITRDSVATVAITSVLGANHVSIEMGREQEYLTEGDTIKTRYTADLNDVFAQLGDVTGRIDGLFDGIGDALTAIAGTPEKPGALQNLNTILEENRTALRDSIENVREITDKINRGDGTIARLINDDEPYRNLLAVVDEIGSAAERASSLMDDGVEMMAHIREGKGTLGNLIYSDELGQEIQAIAANLRDVSERLARGEGTLGRLLVDDTLYREIQSIIHRAERTLEGIGEQGPITAVGVAAGALF